MKFTTKDMVYIALSTTIMVICSFITIPFYVPFTLQTFALFTIIGLFGTKRAFLSICLYLLLGAVGLPVFSGFQSGLGVLFGVTGGYLFGFLLSTLISGFLISLFSLKGTITHFQYGTAMFLGLLSCYIFGTLWYISLYTNSTERISILSVLSLCVLPFIIPDLLKIVLSSYVVKVLKKHIVNP